MTKRQLEDRLAVMVEQRKRALDLLYESRLHLAAGHAGRSLAQRIEALFSDIMRPAGPPRPGEPLP